MVWEPGAREMGGSARVLVAAALVALCNTACASDIVVPAPYDWIQTVPDNYQFLISLLSSNTTATKLFQEPPPNTAFLLPTDSTFESLLGASNVSAAANGVLDLLVMDPADRPAAEVDALLLNHIINGSYPTLKALVAGSPITTLGGTPVRFQGQPADPTPFTGANMTGEAPGFMAGGPQPGPVEAWKEGCSACQAEPAFVGSGNRCLFAGEDVTMFPVYGGLGLLLSD